MRPDARRAVVVGGAGFIGSNLCERLLLEGLSVVCIDDLSTGSARNVLGFETLGEFEFRRHDVCDPFRVDGPVDVVFHLASPASPSKYLAAPIETLRVASLGTFNVLEFAELKGARLVYTSTSEVYGDPEVSPQPETYIGRLDTTVERAVYTEGKRFGEALVSAFRRSRGLDAAIVRLFNTYGPRMNAEDGRLVPAFVSNALAGTPIPVAGSGLQSRSLCYVDDVIDALLLVMASRDPGPLNLGNDDERTVLELAELIRDLCGSSSPIEFVERLADDPSSRRPDIRAAAARLGWAPRIGLVDGLTRAITWYREQMVAA